MSGAGWGALMSGLSSGYMAGKQIERWNNEKPAEKAAPPADTSTGTAVQNYADKHSDVATAPATPGLGVNGMGTTTSQPTVSATGAIGLAADNWQQNQQKALPATASAKAATDTGQWSTLAGIMNQPKV